MSTQYFAPTPPLSSPSPDNRLLEDHGSAQGTQVNTANMSAPSGSAAHRRGPWSQHEDSVLMALIRTHGPYNWVHIAGCLTSRTPKQCRERFHQNLKPSLNHTPITSDEGKRILELVNIHGKRWAEIARHLDNRSDNAVKNWWNGHQNRRKRRSQEPPDSRYEDAFPPGGLGPGGQTPPSMASTADSTPRAPNLPLPPPHIPGSHDHHQSYGRRPQWDAPLPSPISSEGAESDLTSSYTTSPQHGHMAPYGQRSLPRPGDLPPMRPLTQGSQAVWQESNRLPTFGNHASSTDVAYHSAHHGDAHFSGERTGHATPRGDLPTAPNSPDSIAHRQSQHFEQSQHYPKQSIYHKRSFSEYGSESSQYHQQQHRPVSGTQWPVQAQEAASVNGKDPRLSVANLLSNS